jgi:DNA-directed RNA polymerase
MLDLKLIKSELKVLARDDKRSILVAGVGLSNSLPKIKTTFSLLSLPHRIPMIVPGKNYKYKDNKYLELGGYLLNGSEYTDEIILSNWELSSQSTLLDRNDIVEMVNKINSVAFKINESVLEFILLNNDKYGFFTKASYNHPLSLKEKLSLSEHKELESFNSRKHLELNIIGLATIFSVVPCFYFPVRLDYRGRLYCVTEYLNYQGIELAKGLLQFSVGEKVQLSDKVAISYLKIFGSNCFGNTLDKKSFKDRIAWVDNNLENILNFENGLLLNTADNKILFVSFCFEYRKYIQALKNNDTFFITNLPIQLDATCNGFQHLTLLIDDLALSKELNLNESSWKDKPKDFYNFIALRVKNFFNEKLDESHKGTLVLSSEVKESYTKLAKIEIYRVLIKKAVMTIPYNASTSSIVDYIKDNFDKHKNPNFIENSNTNTANKTDFYIYKLKSDLQKQKPVIFTELDFQNLRKALKFVIFVDYPKLTALAEYLKDVAKISNALEIPIPWVLPTGLVIKQQFYEKKTLRVKPFAYTKNMLNLTVLVKTQFNKNKQKIALMPNLVHSLDAASLCLVIVNYLNQKTNVNFYSIHDCFAVPCNKVQTLTGLLKFAYCIIYSDNKYLLEFDANFRSTILNTYGTEAITSKEEKEKIKIKIKMDTIVLKYPSIKSVINSNDFKINLKNSNYLIN